MAGLWLGVGRRSETLRRPGYGSDCWGV